MTTIYVMDDDTYCTLKLLQEELHNNIRAMTFTEQRDFAERWRLAMRNIEERETDAS